MDKKMLQLDRTMRWINMESKTPVHVNQSPFTLNINTNLILNIWIHNVTNNQYNISTCQMQHRKSPLSPRFTDNRRGRKNFLPSSHMAEPSLLAFVRLRIFRRQLSLSVYIVLVIYGWDKILVGSIWRNP